MKITSLCLELTSSCTAKCDMCYLSCSPLLTAKMPLERGIDYIDQASRIEGFASLLITGGEPFMFIDELIALTKAAKAKGFSITCGTNGFWASTCENARIILQELSQAGLDRLTLSVDEFHLRYVPIENVRNILRVIRNTGITVEIACVVTKGSMNAGDIASALGESAAGISINESPCMPIGNAADIIDSDEFVFSADVPYGRCFCENALTVRTDGSVFPCLLTPAVRLGNLNEKSFGEIIDGYLSNAICKRMRSEGTRWFVDAIRAHNIPIQLKERYTGQCDLCHSLFEKEEHLEYFMQISDR